MPLHHLEATFRSPHDMAQGLPPELYQAFQKVAAGVAGIVADARAAAQQASTAAAQGQPGAVAGAALRLPWLGRGKDAAEHATRDAAAWLGRQVEAAEVAKAHLK